MTKAIYNQFFTQISNTELIREFLTFHINKIEILSENEKQMHIGNIPMVDDNIEPKQKAKAYVDFINILEDKEGVAKSVKSIIEITNKKYKEIIDGYIASAANSKDKSTRVMYELIKEGDSKVESLVYLYLKNMEEFNRLYSVYFAAKVSSWKSYPIDSSVNTLKVNLDSRAELLESVYNSEVIMSSVGVKSEEDLELQIIESDNIDYVIISKGEKQKYSKINNDGTIDTSNYDYNYKLGTATVVIAIIKSGPIVMIKSKLKQIDAYDACTVVIKKLYNKDVQFYKRNSDVSQFKFKKENSDLIVASNGLSAWYMTAISLMSMESGDNTSDNDKPAKVKVPERKISFNFKKSLGEAGNIKFWNMCESLGISSEFDGYAVEKVTIKFSMASQPGADIPVRLDKNGANINLLYTIGRDIEKALIASGIIGDWEEVSAIK